MLARQIRTPYEQSYERILVTIKPVSLVVIESKYFVAAWGYNQLDSKSLQYRGLFAVQNISSTM
jgi:hypothetical protein